MSIKRFYNLSLENEGLEIDKILVAQSNVEESSGADQLLNKIELDEQTNRLDDISADQSNADGGVNEGMETPPGETTMDQDPLSGSSAVSTPEGTADEVVPASTTEEAPEATTSSEADLAPQSDTVIDTDVKPVEDPVLDSTSAVDTPVASDLPTDTPVTDVTSEVTNVDPGTQAEAVTDSVDGISDELKTEETLDETQRSVDTTVAETPAVDPTVTEVPVETPENVAVEPAGADETSDGTEVVEQSEVSETQVEEPVVETPASDSNPVASEEEAVVPEAEVEGEDSREEEVQYDEHGIPIVNEDEVERIARECQCNMESEIASGQVTPEVLADIAVASDSSEDVNDQVVEALENYIQIKEIKTALESAMNYGGVDSLGAKIAYGRFKAISEYHQVKATWPSLEKFNSPSMKARSNKLAIEALSEFLAKLIQGVIDGILAFSKMVADYVKKQFNAFTAFKQNIDKLKQAASKITKTNTAEKFKNTNVIKKLVCENDIDVAMNSQILQAYLNNVREPVEKVHRASYEDLKRVMADISEGTTMPPKNDAFIIEIRDFEEVMGRPVPGYDFGEDVTVKVYNYTLPGNYEAIYGLPKDDPQILNDEKRHIAALKACRFAFITKTGQKEYKEIQLLDPNQINDVLDELTKLIDTAEPFQSFFDSFMEEKNKIVRDLKSMAASVNRTKTQNETDEQKSHREGTTMFVESVSSRIAFTEKVYFNAMSSSLQLTSGFIANALTYVTESISAHI